jgi:D-alanine transaminase
MSRIAYVNGSYVANREARVNIEDRGYQFADGVYEVILLSRAGLVDEDLHLDRLERSLREIRIRPPMGRAALSAVMRETARRNRVHDGYVYLQITRGVARRDHAFPIADVAPAVVVTARRSTPPPSDPARFAASAITCPDQRWARCDIKAIALLPNVLARQAAWEKGATEAILVDAAGAITEGAASTVWAVDAAGRLCTRGLDNYVLPGCTRAALLNMVAQENIELVERAIKTCELSSIREMFITSASNFVRPIIRVDGSSIGSGEVGPVTRRLFDVFRRHASNHFVNAA